MKILDFSKYVSERMKVMPITNDEFDSAVGFSEKIENPTFDKIKDGMSVVVDYNGHLETFIAISNENLSVCFDVCRNYDCVLIRYSSSTGDFSYWDLSLFKENFPFHYKNNYIKITDVYDTHVDVKNIKSIDNLKSECNKVVKKIEILDNF
jgi:hypothetical protein